MDEQILLTSNKSPDEMAEIAAGGFANCYAEKGILYQRHSRKCSMKIAIPLWFTVFFVQIYLSFVNIMEFDLFSMVFISIVIAGVIGCTPLFLHDKEFLGVYFSYSPDNKSTILIKYKNPDGTRRFDDDIIYHFIVYLRQKDSTLDVVE